MEILKSNGKLKLKLFLILNTNYNVKGREYPLWMGKF